MTLPHPLVGPGGTAPAAPVIATITPQDISLGVPTYIPVTGCRDAIPLCPTTFLHFYNDGAVDDTIVLTGTNTGDAYDYPCQVATIEAGEELIIGPFDMDAYYPEVSVSHSHPGDGIMAALFIAYESEGCSVASTVVWPLEYTSAPAQPLGSTVVWPDHTDGTVIWCGL